jgi:DNA-binding beta-propeller fold protein YncE
MRRQFHGQEFAAALMALMTAVLTTANAAGGDDSPPLEWTHAIALKGPVGVLDHLALDAERGRLFVANTANGSLDVVDLNAGTLLKQIPGQGRIRGVAYSPETGRVFVGNGTGGVLNVFEGKGYELLKCLTLGIDADNVRYNPRTGRVYVVHEDTELSVIDAKDYTPHSPIPLSKSLGAFQLETSRPRMYVNAKDDGQVVLIDTDKDEVISRFPVSPAGKPSALAIDERKHRIFVGCRRDPSLVVMDSDTGKVVGRVPIPGDVDDVAFDARRGRVYASCGDGAIAVIRQLDADHYEALKTISTVRGARTSAFDAENGLLYLAVPRLSERPRQKNPEVWVYRARP